MSKGQMDLRYMSIPPHPTLRHFNRSILLLKQWTGKEAKVAESVFMGVIAGGTSDANMVQAACGIMDFIMLAQLPTHTDNTLKDMQSVTIIIHGKVRGSTLFVVQDLQTNVVCDRAKQHGQQCYALVKSTGSYLRSSTMEGYRKWFV